MAPVLQAGGGVGAHRRRRNLASLPSNSDPICHKFHFQSRQLFVWLYILPCIIYHPFFCSDRLRDVHWPVCGSIQAILLQEWVRRQAAGGGGDWGYLGGRWSRFQSTSRGLGSVYKFYPGSWCFLNFISGTTLERVNSLIYSGLGILVLLITVTLNFSVIVATLHKKHRAHLGRLRKDVYNIVFLSAIVLISSVCWAPLMVRSLGFITRLNSCSYL